MIRERVEIERRRPFKQSDIEARYEEQDGCCARCPAELGKAFIADHRVPRAMGGKTVLANLDLLCLPCNAAKTHGKGGDISTIAKVKRIERKADPATRPKSKGRKLQGAGFRKDLTKGFDNRVRPRR